MTNEDQGWMRVDSIKGRPSIITSDPSLVIPQSDIVWFAGVPIHHNPALLSLIAPHLDSSRHVFIGSICCYGGFNWVVRSVLGPGNYTPFGTNLIPWCCGTKKYGREGVVFGAKRLLRIVTSEGKDRLRLKEVRMKASITLFRHTFVPKLTPHHPLRSSTLSSVSLSATPISSLPPSGLTTPPSTLLSFTVCSRTGTVPAPSPPTPSPSTSTRSSRKRARRRSAGWTTSWWQSLKH